MSSFEKTAFKGGILLLLCLSVAMQPFPQEQTRKRKERRPLAVLLKVSPARLSPLLLLLSPERNIRKAPFSLKKSASLPFPPLLSPLLSSILKLFRRSLRKNGKEGPNPNVYKSKGVQVKGRGPVFARANIILKIILLRKNMLTRDRFRF